MDIYRRSPLAEGTDNFNIHAPGSDRHRDHSFVGLGRMA